MTPLKARATTLTDSNFRLLKRTLAKLGYDQTAVWGTLTLVIAAAVCIEYCVLGSDYGEARRLNALSLVTIYGLSLLYSLRRFSQFVQIGRLALRLISDLGWKPILRNTLFGVVIIAACVGMILAQGGSLAIPNIELTPNAHFPLRIKACMYILGETLIFAPLFAPFFALHFTCWPQSRCRERCGEHRRRHKHSRGPVSCLGREIAETSIAPGAPEVKTVRQRSDRRAVIRCKYLLAVSTTRSRP